MKSRILFFTIATILACSFAGKAALPVFLPSPGTSITNRSLSNNDQLRIQQMKIFVSMSVVDYGKLSGKKMNFFERISFKITQRSMKQMLKRYDYGDGPDTMQKISWLVKGLLLGPLALILGYIFLKDDERELIKWIWFGFIGFAAFAVIILLTL